MALPAYINIKIFLYGNKIILTIKRAIFFDRRFLLYELF